MRYRLICFDAGFTLLEPRRTMADSLATALAQEGVTPTEDTIQKAWNLANCWFLEEYQRPGNDTWSSDERIRQTWRHYHQLMLAELGVADEDNRIVDAVLAAHFTPNNWQVYPDVLSTLRTLKDLNLLIGIVSDWGSDLPQILQALELTPYLSFTLASATARAAKPSPQLYRMALEIAGVAPQEALMVGDSYYGDIVGAHSVGMDALLLDRIGKTDITGVQIIHSLHEVSAFVSPALKPGSVNLPE